MEQWSYKKAQMAIIYREKAFFTLFEWLKDGIRKQDLVNSIFSSLPMYCVTAQATSMLTRLSFL